jgi:NAD+ diphosphatase
MSAFDSFPLGRPAFVTDILDRAAHLRGHDDKLIALVGNPASRAYVVHRDSLVVKRENGASRALLSIDEALKFGANPGTIFLGLRGGAAVFGMGISQAAAEKLIHGDAGHRAIRRALGDRDGEIAGHLAPAPWLLRQLRNPHRHEGRRLEA